MVIYKYTLLYSSSFKIKLPKGATILSVQIQHGLPCLWAEVDQAADEEDVLISVLGTGHIVTKHPGEYLGTVQDGPYVWHFYKGGLDVL